MIDESQQNRGRHPMVSVVIPAHNESSVIADLLHSLTEGCAADEIQVVVVCNGCSDDTAEVARSFGPPVTVVESAIASKASALRLGDEIATGFPRFYVDADVLLSLDSLRMVADVLRRGPWLAAAPQLRVDLSRCSRLVRAYYAIWTRLPYHASGMIGSGVYAMSQAGRSRFDVFPDIISDDGFARLQFGPEERTSVEGAVFTIRAPATLPALMRIKTRSQKGAVQLLYAFPELARNDVRDYKGSLADILRDPREWANCCVYLYVIVVTKLRAYWLNYSQDLGEWERDDTSRGSRP